jgi:hypothetical protein
MDKTRKVIEGMVKTFMHLLPFAEVDTKGKMGHSFLPLFYEYARTLRSTAQLFGFFS